jgi:hypothetical protein
LVLVGSTPCFVNRSFDQKNVEYKKTWDQDGTDPKIRIFIISAAFLTLLPLAALAVAAANSLFHGLRPIDGLRPRAAKPIST